MRRKRYDSPALVLNEIGSLIFFVHDEWMMHMEDENVKAPPAWKKTVSIPTRLADQMKAQWEAEGWTERTGLFHTQFPNQEEEVHMRQSMITRAAGFDGSSIGSALRMRKPQPLILLII